MNAFDSNEITLLANAGVLAKFSNGNGFEVEMTSIVQDLYLDESLEYIG